MLIENVSTYGLDESVMASGYPMMKDDLSYKRASNLGNCKPGSGHDCFAKGIVVQADVTAPQYWWMQFQRYHFADIVSSQSKMHKILSMNIAEQCNVYVDPIIVDHMKHLISFYNDKSKRLYSNMKTEAFQRIVANCPMGLMLKARIVTNYLQLKTIFIQRRRHKLVEWQKFCDWILTLPKSEIIIEQGESNEG